MNLEPISSLSATTSIAEAIVSSTLASKVALFAALFFTVFAAAFLALAAHRALYPAALIPTAEEIANEIHPLLPQMQLRAEPFAARQDEPIDPFSQVTEQNKQDIATLIKTMSTATVASIPFQRSRLTEIGTRLKQVHPLIFLGIIFSTPDIMGDMGVLRKNTKLLCSFYDSFMNGSILKKDQKGLNQGLMHQARQKNLLCHLPAFARQIGRDLRTIEPIVNDCISEGKFEPLIDFLLDPDPPHLFSFGIAKGGNPLPGFRAEPCLWEREGFPSPSSSCASQRIL